MTTDFTDSTDEDQRGWGLSQKFTLLLGALRGEGMGEGRLDGFVMKLKDGSRIVRRFPLTSLLGGHMITLVTEGNADGVASHSLSRIQVRPR